MVVVWIWDDAADGPFTMIWSLLISLLASFATREVVNGQAPSGREYPFGVCVVVWPC